MDPELIKIIGAGAAVIAAVGAVINGKRLQAIRKLLESQKNDSSESR